MTMPLKIVFCLLIGWSNCMVAVFGQHKTPFGKAVYTSNFGKVERLVRAQILKNKKASTLNYESASSTVTTFVPNLDSIVAWLTKQEGVVDACWNKCENKLLLYPGHSTIGCLLQTKDSLVEKILIVQEGTTGCVRLFGYNFKLTAAKPILVYQKMCSSNGFVLRQYKLCNK